MQLIKTFHKMVLFIADSIVIIFGFWIGYILWIYSPLRIHPHPPSFSIAPVIVLAVLFNIIMFWGKTYETQNSVFHVVQLKDLVKYTFFGYILAIVVGFFSKAIVFGRLQALYVLFILIPLIILERTFIDKLWHRFIVDKYQTLKVVIYGAGDTGKRLLRAMQKHPKLGYHAIAFFDDEKCDDTLVMANGIPVFGGEDEFIQFMHEYPEKVDEVFIAMPKASSRRVLKIMKICDEVHVDYKFVPSLNKLALHKVRMEQLDGIPLFGIQELSISAINAFLKRILDVIVSALTLLITSPLLIIFYLLIKRDSSGPAIFSQNRVGKKGKQFKMYKFRTMFLETPQYAEHPQEKDDPRITKIGRYLRRTSLDELPQFWNVLKGDMSIVGPRPEMPFIVEEYNEVQLERLNVKPGITGLWQISGDRSLPIHENIDHDLYYIENQSLLLDIIIIMQTIWFALIRGVGAK